jgi:AraC-like DNA-binding protein
MRDSGRRLFSRTLPALMRALKPDRIFFDRTRRSRRMRQTPARWAEPPRGFPPAHRHPVFEICVMLSGRCPFAMGERIRWLRRGDVVILPPEVFHRELAVSRCGPYQLLWLRCERGGVCAHMQDHLGGGRFDREAFHHSFDGFPDGLRIAEALDVELWEDRPGAFALAQSLLLELCGRLERAWAARLGGRAAPSKAGEARQRSLLTAAMEYVRDNFAHPLELGEAAAHVNISPAYLSVLFTRFLGRSFTDFLTACRLEEAQRLLGGPTLSIKEISARVGIDNPFYFSRVFRRRLGMSPVEFRRRRLAGGGVRPSARPKPRGRRRP